MTFLWPSTFIFPVELIEWFCLNSPTGRMIFDTDHYTCEAAVSVCRRVGQEERGGRPEGRTEQFKGLHTDSLCRCVQFQFLQVSDAVKKKAAHTMNQT